MALPNIEITIGAPPLLWSDVHAAFEKINENFQSLDLATGGSAVDLSTINSNISPAIDNQYFLGKDTNKWKAIYTSSYIEDGGNEINGVWLGVAQIKGIGTAIDIPEGSTVNGNLIIDPEKTFFKEIQVDNNQSIVATQFSDSFNLLSGNGVNLIVTSSADSIQIENTGILNITDGLGINHTNVSGVATITNTGVRSLQSTTSLPIGRTAGAGININGSTGDNLKITNTGVISISSGVGITVSADAATGDVTITNSAPAVNAFTQIQVNGDSANRLLADAVSDVLNITSGEGITLTKTPSTDTLTITVNPVFDLKGSVFGDDSSTLVDAVNGYIYGNVSATTLRTTDSTIALGNEAGLTSQTLYAIAIGDGAGKTSQGDSSVAIGLLAGESSQGNFAVAVGINSGLTSQGTNAVAIGSTAGNSGQGANSIAIGAGAGYLNQTANSIILNASGGPFNGSAAGFYVNPVRSTANGIPLMYDTTTKELFYSTVLEFVGSKISTTDSSGLTVDVLTTFNTDIIAENDLTVAEKLIVKGSRVINLNELKSIVAASTSFADFQSRIAALV